MSNGSKQTTEANGPPTMASGIVQRLGPSQLRTRAIIIIGVGLIFLAALLFDPEQFSISSCYFRELTGHPCPSCGLTRSLHAMAHLNFQQAMAFHPMGMIFFIALLIWLFIAVAEIILRKPIRIDLSNGMKKFAVISLILIWAIWWITRLFGSS